MEVENHNIQKHLQTPKTIDELHEELQEDMDWNREQLELYLTLNQKVEKNGDKWKINEISKEEKILRLLRKELTSKPLFRIDKFVENLPYGLVFGADDIRRIVKQTDDLNCPNKKVVTTQKA